MLCPGFEVSAIGSAVSGCGHPTIPDPPEMKSFPSCSVKAAQASVIVRLAAEM